MGDRMKFLKALSLSALIALPFTAEAKTKFTTPVNDDFGEFEFPFRNGGGIFGKVRIMEQDGKLYLCGAAYIQNVDGRFAREFLNAIHLKANDKIIVQGVRYFNTVHKSQFKNGIDANCAETTAKLPLPRKTNFEWGSTKNRFYE